MCDGSEAPGNHYCNYAHYHEAKCLWEEAHEVGLEAASVHFDEQRKLRQQTYAVPHELHTRLISALMAYETVTCSGGVEEVKKLIYELNQLEPISDSVS